MYVHKNIKGVFPKDYTDSQIMDELKIMGNTIAKGSSINHTIIMGIKSSVGFSELSRRESIKQSELFDKQIELSKQQSDENRKITLLSLGLSILAVILAGTSSCFAYLDWKGDESWKRDQIELLKNIELNKK